jgi:hypothetical protein
MRMTVGRSLSFDNHKNQPPRLQQPWQLRFFILTSVLGIVPPVTGKPGHEQHKTNGLGRKDSNLRMPESKSGALTSLATPHP